MMIVDAHAHLGKCRIFDLEVTREMLLSAMDSVGVQTALVQPFPGCDDPVKTHDEIARLGKEFPGRFYGVASINPHLGEASWKELRRCVEDLGFVGVKLHTIGHAISPTSKDGMRLFELAGELAVPVLVHTGTGVPFALPSMCIPPAKEFPEVKIVLCHAGYAVYAGEAIIVAKEYPNVYLEPSWCTPVQIRSMINQLGSDRVFMGSDLPPNLPVETAKMRLAGLPEEQLADYLGRTARRVFNI